MIDVEAFPVLVSHRDALVHAGLFATLASERGFQVQSCIAADDMLVRLRQQRGTGIAVADYDTALELLQACRRPPVVGMPLAPAVLIVSWRSTEAEIRRALEAGVRGYLIGDCGLADLVDGVRALQRGGRFLGEAVAHSVAESLTRVRLTARETDVLRLMATGCPNKTIAARLDIAIGTVKAHTKAILSKLDASSRTEATVIAKQRGLLSCDALPPPPAPYLHPLRHESASQAHGRALAA
jgi:DNA-binding NarL/FixJ family response regulator